MSTFLRALGLTIACAGRDGRTGHLIRDVLRILRKEKTRCGASRQAVGRSPHLRQGRWVVGRHHQPVADAGRGERAARA
jgi:hypothetical protein